MDNLEMYGSVFWVLVTITPGGTISDGWSRVELAAQTCPNCGRVK